MGLEKQEIKIVKEYDMAADRQQINTELVNSE